MPHAILPLVPSAAQPICTSLSMSGLYVQKGPIMARSHTHHPDGAGPICSFGTKRECDLNFRQWSKDRKDELEREIAAAETIKKEARVKRFDAFIESEKQRSAKLR